VPSELLSHPPEAGFFGKLPTSGDFVTRGLPPTFRQRWDAWVTRHLVPRMAADWPEGGLRFVLPSGGRCALGLILPGQDRLGRRFPLTLAVIVDGQTAPQQADAWCEAALPLARRALEGDLDADELWLASEGLAPPAAAMAEKAIFWLWRDAAAPVGCDPSTPEDALDQLIGRGPT